MKKNTILLILLSFIIVLACKKKETDTVNPVISISSPTEGQMFNAGDSLLVSFSVTDVDLHGFDYAVISTATNDTLFSGDEHTHASATFSRKFILEDAATQYILSVNGEDHTGNTSNKVVHFHTM